MNDEIKQESLSEDGKKKKIKSIVSWTITIVVCLVLAKLFTTFVIRSVEVDGGSMSTTLSDGDKAITDALFYKFSGINRFDIVIVKKKEGSYKDQELVKRVIALPGETIEYKEGVLYINGEVVEETFIKDEVKSITGTINKKTLGDDEYFVMGDNRGKSADSRLKSIGLIKKNEIKGRGMLRFMVCVKKDGNECIKRKLIWPSSVK